MTTVSESLGGGLPELSSDLLSFTMQLKKSSDPGDAETLRLKIDEQFKTLDLRARQNDIPQEDVQQAKYALAAFIDETILTSSWALKDTWAGKPLQLEYFNDFSAGEEFYNKIDALRAVPAKVGVLEVYYLCLALGFRGKYVDLQGMEKKKVLMDTLAREIRAAQTTEGQIEGLSPRWQPPDELPSLVRGLPAWLVAASCGVFLLLLYIVLALILGSMTDGVVKELGS